MARRRRPIGMSNKEKFYRSVGLMSAFFMLISCFVLITTLVMDISGINVVEIDEPRVYCIYFWSEDRFLGGSDKYIRGEKIQIPGNPSREEEEYYRYVFRGWDITGDNTPDIVPTRAFFGFDAVAVYQKIQTKPLPKPSSSEPEEGSSSEQPSSSVNSAYIVEGVNVYGA